MPKISVPDLFGDYGIIFNVRNLDAQPEGEVRKADPSWAFWQKWRDTGLAVGAAVGDSPQREDYRHIDRLLTRFDSETLWGIAYYWWMHYSDPILDGSYKGPATRLFVFDLERARKDAGL